MIYLVNIENLMPIIHYIFTDIVDIIVKDIVAQKKIISKK
jgi:hypothetical protein